ncbi:glucose 1-dehydrogenase [Inquilinus limosus]|uniref:3-ketoacyl-ACP reductase n=1 Tax=Inquilinus limosus MP06 TaxID=1398085 RepID=A0A0A0D3X1_9PROT|nr:glucose 1-dehydrogenase [Inquilinus limosus]KGM32508.1 3-ketoacyl-ACP reductase [Inquilinus limosus MP06]
MRLEGKVAIVTGAASGFGKGIAERFVREGASVLIADLSAEAGEAVAAALNEVRPDAARFVRTDVSRDADTAVAIATAVEAFGGLDIVVNNAGYTHRNKPMAEVTEDEFDRIFAVNVKAIFLAVRHAAPHLQAKGGSILNIASTAGIRPRPGLTWYNASKGAVITATKSMAVELAPKIRVNCLCPVLGQTGLTSTFLGDDTPERRAQFLATIPLGRMSTPEDIANAALYLSSDEASMVTGVALEVDGGRCI